MSPQRKSEKVYLVRDDSFFCTGKKQTEFVEEFCQILQNYTDARVISFDSKKQIQSVRRYLNKYHNGKSIVSLDKWFVGDFNYNLSRIFEKGKDQSRPLRFFGRNINEFRDWVRGKKSYEFVIVDDDIASGSTMNHVFDILKQENVGYPETVSMEAVYNKKYNGRVYDIVDIRDFIPGSKNGGLFCLSESGLERIPYFYPEVDLVSRMKLTKHASVLFTRDLKELIQKHFPNNE